MNRIGIIVSRVSSGAEILFSSEAAKKWQHEALDTRNYLKCIDVEKISEDKFDSSFFDFVTFGSDVAFICTNKYISGRDSDLISAMIVVPGSVDVTGKELTDILHTTKEILLETKRDDQKLEEICTTDYGVKHVQNHSVPSIAPNSEGQYAYRYYGSNTPFSLSEILGSIFQKYYCNYKAVFLIDAVSRILPKEGLINLTQSDLKNSCVLEYPTSVPSDIKIEVNGRPFTQRQLFDEGQEVTLEFFRKNCRSIKENVKLTQSINAIDLTVLNWHFKVDSSWFKVYDEAKPNTKIPYSSIRITINDKEVGGDKFEFFNTDDLTHAKIVIKVAGYKKINWEGDLLSIRRPIPVPLKEQLSIDGRKSKRDDVIVLVKKYEWNKIVIGLVVLLFACIGLISSGVRVHQWIFQENKSQGQSTDTIDTGAATSGGRDVTEEGESTETQCANLKEYEYLKENAEVWNRNDMEQISSRLTELYDDVNWGRFSKIRNKWQVILSETEVKNYRKLVDIAKLKKKDRKTHYSTDGTITITRILGIFNPLGTTKPKDPKKPLGPKNPLDTTNPKDTTKAEGATNDKGKRIRAY